MINKILASLPKVLDAVEYVWDECVGEEPVKPIKNVHAGIAILTTLDIKEIHTNIDGEDRIFQWCPEASEHHWFEFSQDTNKLGVISDADLQYKLQKLLEDIK